MFHMIDRDSSTFRWRSLFLALSLVIAASGPTQGEPLEAGPDGVFVLDSQHPALYTTMSHALKEHAELIDATSPQRFAMTDSGDLQPLGNGSMDWAAYVASAHRRGVKVLPMVRNFSPAKLLADPAAIDRGVQNLKALCLEHGFDGLVLDFEHLTSAEREPMVDLMTKLYAWMQEHGRLLMLCVNARAWDDQWDYLALSRNSDALFVMFYDYTGSWTKGKEPGPTAPMVAWPGHSHTIERDLDALIDMGVPASKIIMGIPEYGHDFTLDDEGKVASSTPYWINELREIAREHGAKEKWDTQKQAPYFEYTDASGVKHQVWYESARSYRAKLDLVRSKNIAGIATWASRWPDQPTDEAFWPTVEEWLSAEPSP